MPKKTCQSKSIDLFDPRAEERSTSNGSATDNASNADRQTKLLSANKKSEQGTPSLPWEDGWMDEANKASTGPGLPTTLEGEKKVEQKGPVATVTGSAKASLSNDASTGDATLSAALNGERKPTHSSGRGVGVSADVKSKNGVFDGASGTLSSKSGSATKAGTVHVDKGGKVTGLSVSKGVDSDTSSAAVTANFDKDLNLSGVSGSYTAKGGDKGNVTVSGDTAIKVDEPVEKDGKWVVTYSVSTNGKVGWDKSVEGSGGGKTSGGVHANTGQSKSGQRTFADPDAAKKFAEQARKPGFLTEKGLLNIPSSSDKLSGLGVGDKRAIGDTTGFGASLSRDVGVVSVGLSAGASKSAGFQVERLDKNTVDVTRTATGSENWGVSLKTSLIGMGYSEEYFAGSTFTFRLNPSTKSGRAAYDALVQNQPLPKSGWKVSWTHFKGQKNTTNAGPLFRSSKTMSWKSKKMNGDTVEGDLGEESSGYSVPLLGSHATSHTLIGTELNDKDRSWVFRAGVSGTTAGLTSNSLGNATGTVPNENLATDSPMTTTKSSGAWSVDFTIPDRKMAGLVKRLQSIKDTDSIKYMAVKGGRRVSGDGPQHTEKLIYALKAAGSDTDAQRAALAKWVSEAGDHALSQLRELGDLKPDYHLHLAGDPNFPGLIGRLKLQRQIGRLKALAESPPAGGASQVVAAAQSLLGKQLDRLAAISNLKKYAELPRELRQKEVSRINFDITVLKKILEVASKPSITEQSSPNSSSAAGTDFVSEDGTLPTDNTAMENLQEELKTQNTFIDDYREETQVQLNLLQLTLEVQNHDPTGRDQSLRQEYGKHLKLGMDWAAADGEETGAFDVADFFQRVALLFLESAQQQEKEHVFMSAPIGETQLKMAIRSAESVVSAYQTALQMLKVTDTEYTKIEARHWQSYDKDGNVTKYDPAQVRLDHLNKMKKLNSNSFHKW